MAGGRPDPDAVAYHLQQAGDPRAWEWLVRAGERAQRAYAWLTAAERLPAAATCSTDVPGKERTRGWLLYRLGELSRSRSSGGSTIWRRPNGWPGGRRRTPGRRRPLLQRRGLSLLHR